MNVKRQLLFIMLFVTVCFFTFTFLLKLSIDRNIDEILQEKLLSTRNITIEKAFKINTNDIAQCTNDYSLWNEFVDFVQHKKGTSWIKTEIVDNAPSYRIDYLWVLDSSAKIIYYNIGTSGLMALPLNIPDLKFKKTLKNKPFSNFFIQHNNDLVEIFTAPIQPSYDKRRCTKPKGYFITGRIVNESFLNNLKDISPEIDFSLSPVGSTIQDSIDLNTTSISFHQPLYAYDGSVISLLQVRRSYSGLNKSHHFLNTCLIIFLLAISILSIIFFRVTTLLVLRPLHKISEALVEKKSDKLIPNLSKTNEFGAIATMMVDFFSQNEKLITEVETRTKSEQALIKAIDDKDEAQNEKKQMELFLFQQQQLLQYNNKHSKGNIDQKINEIIALGAAAINCERAGAWFYNHDNSAIESNHIYTLSTNSYSSGAKLFETDYPNYFNHLKQDTIISVDDAQLNPITSEFTENYLKPLGITSMLDVPISINNKVIGVVCYEHIGKKREWKIYEQMFTRTISDFLSINIETENRKKIENELLYNQIRFEETEEMAHIGNWELNFETNICNGSKEFCRIFELLDSDEIDLYNAFIAKISNSDKPLFESLIQEIKYNFKASSLEFKINCLNDHQKYIASMVQPIMHPTQPLVIGVRGTAQDITKQKLAALAKSDFLSSMSHEIRTPINGIVGIAGLLQEETLSHKQTDYVNTLNFSAQHLSTVVSDILDFSKIESGHMSFEKVSFNIEKNCKYIFELFAQKASEKNIKFILDSNNIKTENSFLYGDYVRLNQIISNLLSNAIKFTENGFVKFSYKVETINEEGAIVKFNIKDTGIGMTEKQQGQIFESFTQADKSITRQYGGTGLGLTISKKLVELQGGKIEVRSALGEGSEFEVTMPFEKHVYKDFEIAPLIDKISDVKNLNGMKILVAEDNAINAMVLTRFLSKWQIDSKLAKDGVEALELLRNEPFDLIMMDIQMPNLNGIEATKMIRNLSETNYCNIPIVAFTADASIDLHRELLKQGFNHCLTKPFNPDTLFSYLKSMYKMVNTTSKN
ncbi:MAG: hypothetical protein RIQ33_1444 [Bacteroidota bacterium]